MKYFERKKTGKKKSEKNNNANNSLNFCYNLCRIIIRFPKLMHTVFGNQDLSFPKDLD